MRVYTFQRTAPNGKPGTDVTEQLITTGSEIPAGPGSPLTVMPYVREASPTVPEVLAAALALKRQGVALALDQPRGLIFVDPRALEQVASKYPAVVEHSSLLEFSFDDLCEALVFAGHRVWNISINRYGDLEFYERFRKRPWHFAGKRWWQD